MVTTVTWRRFRVDRVMVLYAKMMRSEQSRPSVYSVCIEGENVYWHVAVVLDNKVTQH